MIRTQMQLPEETYKELRRTAQRLNRSMADCIREAIVVFLDRCRRQSEDWEELAGKYQALPTDSLKPHDQYWAATRAAEKPTRYGK